MINNFELRFHHDHDHSHEHSHDHDHAHHGHVHSHDEEENKDEKTLKVLLVHWVNHNESHKESFIEWVQKSKELGKDDCAYYIEKAVEFIDKANEMLIEAKKHM